jgi:hypothetical protein
MSDITNFIINNSTIPIADVLEETVAEEEIPEAQRPSTGEEKFLNVIMALLVLSGLSLLCAIACGPAISQSNPHYTANF